MASSKKNKTPQDQAIAAKRVEFVKANPNLDPAEARKRFFVQTRASELQAKGVEVTKQKRQELRQKFASGGVQRQGFYTPGDLQRIAAAKANSGSKPPVTPEPSGTPSVKPQDLADYKNTVYSNLSKENTARRPVAPKATSKKGFDEQSFNPMQFFKSPLARGVAGVAKGAYNIAESSAESFNATFVNPSLNLLNKGLDKLPLYDGSKVPKYREAGPMEAAINTADVILTIATAGASKGATVPLKGLLPAKQGVIKSATSKLTSKIAAGGKSQVIRGTEEYAEQAIKGLGKGPKTGSVDLATGVYQPLKNAKGKVIVPKSKAFPRGLDETPSFLKTPKTPKPTGSKVTGVDDYVSNALQNIGKGQKAGSVDLATGKYNPPSYSKMKDIDIDLKFGNAAEKANAKKAASKLNPQKPKATPKSKPAAAKPKASKEVNRFVDAWDDSPIDMSKVDFSEFGMESSKPYSTARRAAKKTDDVTPAPAPKPAAKKAAPKKSTPKTTAPKANAKVAFDKSVAPFKTGSQTKLTFKTQADYNQFLKTGGKERLRQMSPDVRASFERVNEKWMKGATEARQAAESAQKNNAARALARKGRYDRARPALKAKFNEALIKKQERELLAKVTKKK